MKYYLWFGYWSPVHKRDWVPMRGTAWAQSYFDLLAVQQMSSNALAKNEGYDCEVLIASFQEISFEEYSCADPARREFLLKGPNATDNSRTS